MLITEIIPVYKTCCHIKSMQRPKWFFIGFSLFALAVIIVCLHCVGECAGECDADSHLMLTAW